MGRDLGPGSPVRSSLAASVLGSHKAEVDAICHESLKEHAAPPGGAWHRALGRRQERPMPLTVPAGPRLGRRCDGPTTEAVWGLRNSARIVFTFSRSHGSPYVPSEQSRGPSKITKDDPGRQATGQSHTHAACNDGPALTERAGDARHPGVHMCTRRRGGVVITRSQLQRG